MRGSLASPDACASTPGTRGTGAPARRLVRGAAVRRGGPEPLHTLGTAGHAARTYAPLWPSSEFDLCGLYDGAPLGDFPVDEHFQLRRRAATDHGTELIEKLLSLGRLEKVVDPAVELGDHVAGNPRGRK